MTDNGTKQPVSNPRFVAAQIVSRERLAVNRKIDRLETQLESLKNYEQTLKNAIQCIEDGQPVPTHRRVEYPTTP